MQLISTYYSCIQSFLQEPKSVILFSFLDFYFSGKVMGFLDSGLVPDPLTCYAQVNIYLLALKYA